MINNGGCAQICTDTADSFQCSCTSGFMLAGNNLDCVGKIATKGSCGSREIRAGLALKNIKMIILKVATQEGITPDCLNHESLDKML